MKNISNITGCIILSLLFLSCNDYLEKTPDDQMTEEEVFQRYDKVNQLVTDLYDNSKNSNKPLVFFGHFSSAPVTDECEGSTAEGSLTNKFNTGDWSPAAMPDKSSTGQYWWDIYKNIRKANVIIHGIEKYNTPDNPLNPGDLEKRLGEAYFFRGYLHYLAIRMYGEAPYIDYLIDPSGSMEFYRESVHSVVEKIIADAQEAYNRVQNRYTKTDNHFGRVDKGACLGLIAMARWIAATPIWNGAKEMGYDGEHQFQGEYTYDVNRWIAARDAAKAVLDFTVEGKTRYTLYDGHDENDFNDDGGRNLNDSKVYARLWDLYHSKDAFENEYVWFVTRDKDHNWQGDVYPPSRGGGSRQMPIQEQVDEYEYISPDGYGYPVYGSKAVSDGYDDGNPYESVKRDPRFHRDIIYHGAPFRDNQNNKKYMNTAEGSDRINSSNATTTGYYLRKLFKESWNREGGFQINSPAIWRLPHFIYIYCEAVNEAAGPNKEIYDLVNKVRARSFMAPMPVAAMQNKELMKEYIHRERRVELFYENERIWGCRLYLEPNNPTELAKEAKWKAAGSTNDERSQRYWAQANGAFPKCQRMANGMRPVEDPNGKIEVDGKKYRMERFCLEERVFVTPRHYHFPIMNDELQRSPSLGQNPGW